jgi:threonine/homoserine/homoserine lactone efflux protein
MLTYLIFGSGYAFAAAIQPGPLQAFLIARVAANGWRRTLPASLAPLISDGPIAVVAVLLIGQLSLRMQNGLQAAGGLLLIYFAWTTFRRWRGSDGGGTDNSAPQTLLEAVVVNLLNPNPYLGWSLVLGPSVHAAWQEHPAHAVVLIVAFYATMASTLAAFILFVGTVGRLGTRAQRALIGVSASVLACLGLYLVARAASALLGA